MITHHPRRHVHIRLGHQLRAVDWKVGEALTRHPLLATREGADAAKLANHGVLVCGWQRVAWVRVGVYIIHIARRVIVGAASGVSVDWPSLPVRPPRQGDDVSNGVRWCDEDAVAVLLVECLPLDDGWVVATRSYHCDQIALIQGYGRVGRAAILLDGVLSGAGEPVSK